MGIIRWTDKFSVNDARIDNQHKKWIKIFNNAHTRMMDYSVAEGLSIGNEALKEMVSYTKYHFASEEELMGKIGYPDIEKHKIIHREFIQELDRSTLQIHQGESVLNSQIIKLIENWFVYHILEEDQKYKEYTK